MTVESANASFKGSIASVKPASSDAACLAVHALVVIQFDTFLPPPVYTLRLI